MGGKRPRSGCRVGTACMPVVEEAHVKLVNVVKRARQLLVGACGNHCAHCEALTGICQGHLEHSDGLGVAHARVVRKSPKTRTAVQRLSHP
jgi:hypothetical protein